MEEIMDLCESIQSNYFNLDTIKSCDTFFFDLDNTLRIGSHWSGDILYDLSKIKNKNVFILTNNTTHSLQSISKFTKLPLDNIINPLCSLPIYIDTNKYIYVIGNSVAKTQIQNMNYNIVHPDHKYDAIVFANSYFLTSEDWMVISNNQDSKLFFTEMVESVKIGDNSDIDQNVLFGNSLIIPDMGCYGDIIKKLYPKLYSTLIVLGKPNPNIIKKIKINNRFVIIGDSLNSDIKFSYYTNSYGILLSTNYEPGYNYQLNCYIINSLDDLDYIFNKKIDNI
jgi:ribonucleotide monophosphatase NagD (HAD superfamily)